MLTPAWGGQATGGAEALWGRETMATMGHGGLSPGNRLAGEVGYGLPLGGGLVGRRASASEENQPSGRSGAESKAGPRGDG